MSQPTHQQWDGARLLLALGVCVAVVVAAVIFDRCS